MPTNLRLTAEAAAALRIAAQRTGRSQQDLLREAVDQYLRLHRSATSRAEAIASGLVREPTPFRDSKPSIKLAPGMTSVELLNRDEDR